MSGQSLTIPIRLRCNR